MSDRLFPTARRNQQRCGVLPRAFFSELFSSQRFCLERVSISSRISECHRRERAGENYAHRRWPPLPLHAKLFRVSQRGRICSTRSPVALRFPRREPRNAPAAQIEFAVSELTMNTTSTLSATICSSVFLPAILRENLLLRFKQYSLKKVKRKREKKKTHPNRRRRKRERC